jgi:hypothetical protein
MTVVSFVHSFFKEREINWLDLSITQKEILVTQKKRDIYVQSKEKLIVVIDDTSRKEK